VIGEGRKGREREGQGKKKGGRKEVEGEKEGREEGKRNI
jgi:hypothetical protein